MYDKLHFACDLKKKVAEKQSAKDIGAWAHSIYLGWPDCEDDNFLDLLLDLGSMELGPDFAFTYEELNQIADDLMAGRDVKL